MRTLVAAFCILCAFLPNPSLLSGAELKVLTEVFPPFNYSEGDTVQGFSTTIVRKVLDNAGLDYSIELVPWKRAYNRALENPNTLIYTIAKTEARKDKFHWIGKIANRRVSLFRLRSRKDLAEMTLAEAKEKAAIAAIQSDASTETLLAMGFKAGNITLIRDSTISNLCMRHVIEGRSDFFPMNPYTLRYRIEEGKVENIFEEQFVIHDEDGYYLAASLSTDEETVGALKDAFGRLAETGFIEKTVDEFLQFPQGSAPR